VCLVLAFERTLSAFDGCGSVIERFSNTPMDLLCVGLV
jgi:hypothetical protein